MKKFLSVAALALLCCTFEASVRAQSSGVRVGPSADDVPVSNNYNRKAPRTDAKPAAKIQTPPAATKASTPSDATTDNANADTRDDNIDAKGNGADKNPAETTTNVSSASTATGIDANSPSMTTDAPAKTTAVPAAPIVAASKNDSSATGELPLPSNSTSSRKGDALPSKTAAPKSVENNTAALPSNAASKLNAPKTANKPATNKTAASATTIPVSSTTTPPPVALSTSATPSTTTPVANAAVTTTPTNAATNAAAPASTTTTLNNAAAPPATAVVLPPTETYRIGAGDVLDIRLLNQGATRESTLFTVIDGGLLEYPLAGAPRVVTGLTTDEIGALLAEELQRRAVYEKPRVIVSVREYASHTVLVSGLVGEPGAKIMRREAMPLYVVVAEAQPKPEAGRAVVVSRATGQTTTVDLTDNAAMNALVYAGDVVQVQPRPREFFYIGGAITMPGQKDFHSGLTLTQAVLASGGLIDAANNRVRVSRQGADGRLVSTEYVLKDIDTGKVPDPGLQPGDRIEVVRGKR